MMVEYTLENGRRPLRAATENWPPTKPPKAPLPCPPRTPSPLTLQPLAFNLRLPTLDFSALTPFVSHTFAKTRLQPLYNHTLSKQTTSHPSVPPTPTKTVR